MPATPAAIIAQDPMIAAQLTHVSSPSPELRYTSWRGDQRLQARSSRTTTTPGTSSRSVADVAKPRRAERGAVHRGVGGVGIGFGQHAVEDPEALGRTVVRRLRSWDPRRVLPSLVERNTGFSKRTMFGTTQAARTADAPSPAATSQSSGAKRPRSARSPRRVKTSGTTRMAARISDSEQRQGRARPRLRARRTATRSGGPARARRPR